MIKRGYSCSSLCSAIRAQIPTAASERISAEFAGLSCNPYYYENLSKLSLKCCKVLTSNLPNTLIHDLMDVKTGNRGFLELTGVPRDPGSLNSINSPEDVRKNKVTFVKEFFALGLSALFGQEVFNYPTEWDQGALIANIFPSKALKKTGAGGTAAFRFHVENAWHPRRVSTLLLVGMRQDYRKQAVTYCISVKDILNKLMPSQIEILQKPIFRISPPAIHSQIAHQHGIPFLADDYYIGPIISYDAQGQPEIRVNFNGLSISSLEKTAQCALQAIEDIAENNAYETKLSVDNLLVLNNHKSLHSRNSWEPETNRLDRWIQRYFFTDPETLWPERKFSVDDFVGILGSEKAHELYMLLRNKQILDGQGKLTSAFRPYKPDFDLTLPTPICPYKKIILKTLISGGPVKPDRLV